MLSRIDFLVNSGADFAFETTLATKSYKNLVRRAQDSGYKVTLLFFYLRSEKLAIERVRYRVEEGGHNIPVPVIKRRYRNGLNNFFNIYKEIVNEWTFIETTGNSLTKIARKRSGTETIFKKLLWDELNKTHNENRT